ncbi:MAG TPA: DoxX family protein [Burkholderiaceae bacterium]|nr:DoxX family protein [Burkholderiaceae bacterium]
MQRWLPTLGRLMIAAIFLWSGYGKVMSFTGSVAYIASKGLPLPQVLAAGAIAVELLGGAALVLGWRTRFAAVALFIFTLAAALLFHNFWMLGNEQHRVQLIQFLKNLAMCGGLLYVMAFGAGALAVDRGR